MELSEPLMDCNFPEMLAGDLGRSAEVFKSKNLTAGAPTVSLSEAGVRRERRGSLQDRSSLPFSSQARDILSRMKSLQMVNQDCYSQVMASINVESRKSIETIASESSGGMEPPSIAGRGVSITTAATSVSGCGSTGRTSPSDKSNSPTDKISISNRSWVDLELEDNDSTVNDHLKVANNNFLLNLERCHSLGNLNPPTIPESPKYLGEPRSMSMTTRMASRRAADPFTAFSSPTKTSRRPKNQQDAQPIEGNRLMQPTEFPTRRSSLSHASLELLQLPQPRIVPRSPPSPIQLVPSNVSQRHLHPNVTPVRPPSSGRGLNRQMVREEEEEEEEEARSMLSLSDEEEEEDSLMDLTLMTPQDKIKVASPAIVSPLADIEQWVDQSSTELSHSHSSHPTKDFQGSRIPIAPEVLDTLRVSVACFPETMLLCSSLSIETIRGNSKKFRFRTPNHNTASQVSLNLQDNPAKSSKWKWLPTKKISEHSPTKLEFQSRSSIDPLGETAGTRSECPEWYAIKNIFPTGTDHLCDALYAHILAYNYITSICPRSAVVIPAARPVSKQSSHPSISTVSNISSRISELSAPRSGSNGIPTKAATLLGLQTDPSTTIAPPRETPATRPSTLRGKTSFLKGRRENAKSFVPINSRTADDHDQSLKDLRLGLAKCIARLVGTLRLASSEDFSTSSKPVDGKDIDSMFIRALCEVVRCNEER
ncbi:hypothetical protein BKA67DRAFT_87679 [Truncatella angustata]|uniref:Uncharacterized protein n=1 Tax=Truncatella angustata TaxID=152316 RepID=A0A9P8RM15_9PEZI|nr:uncharacterized protein BKA67DRAFT_87679 [Truncatella angustata]KAH6645840.1 hypothetical protein BKA67DRAFT_87679 [Truncatella angustata]KAH8201990.1 hypothetical protein TruAng_003833 [Truncatella angustata]